MADIDHGKAEVLSSLNALLDHLKQRIRRASLTALDHRDAESGGRTLLLRFSPGQVLDEVVRFRRGILANGETITAAKGIRSRAGTAFHGREGEPAESTTYALSIIAIVVEGIQSPLPHRIYSCFAAAHKDGFIAL